MLALSTKIKKAWVEIKKSYPTCEVLIFISSLGRETNKILGQYVEEIDVIIDSGANFPVEYIQNDISSKNVSLLSSIYRNKLDGKDDAQNYGRYAGVFKISFDGQGNITIGIKDHIIFPEISVENVENIFGFDFTIATSANNDKEGYELLKLMNFPFLN